MLILTLIAGSVCLAFGLASRRAAAPVWLVAYAAFSVLVLFVFGMTTAVGVAVLAYIAAAVLLYPSALRRHLLSRSLVDRFRRQVPRMSQSEREALEAGTVWWDGELLSGAPDWARLRALPSTALTREEQAYLDGPVRELCEMIDEWRVANEWRDLPPEAWAHIKRHRFFGMIIPQAYGGLGFSAVAHSQVILMLTSRSPTAAVTVMVPNALGPAELLLHAGTQAQREYYLPRLASGEDIPCFALTSPEAGSDAASIPDYGVVCHGTWQGRSDVLGMRLTWEKRYITLAPVATLLGLAFRLYDPERLLGRETEVGITLALVPTDTPGVHIGRRHRPMDAAFMNGPTWGRDVFVPLELVIGGAERAGDGWAMLMNSLAAGRGVSLPANSCGVAKMCALTAGAYSRVRRQFGLPLARFEGVEAALARIAGNTYLMEAARTTTLMALDAGEKPAVVSAIVKCSLTERAREVVNDAMDVHGGKALCMGPSNYLAQAYQQVPIAITVEGANILLRSLFIFGQGAVRGHPFLRQELRAVEDPDVSRGLRAFDRALFGHIAFFLGNAVRTAWLGFMGPRTLPAADGGMRVYYAQLTRFSAALAFVADVVLVTLGGSLKRRERMSARLADILSLLYLASCVVKRYEDAGSEAADRPLVEWAVSDSLRRVHAAFEGVFANIRPSLLGRFLRAMVFARGARVCAGPTDAMDRRAAHIISEAGAARDRLVAGVFISRRPEDAIATLEAALQAVLVSEPVEAHMRASGHDRALHVGDEGGRVRAALQAGVITTEEASMVNRAREMRRTATMVDDFSRELAPDSALRSTDAVSFGPRADSTTHTPDAPVVGGVHR